MTRHILSISVLALGALCPVASPALGATIPFTYAENFESATVGDTLPAGWFEPNVDFDVVTGKAVQFIGGGTSPVRAVYLGDSNESISSANWLDYNMTLNMSSGNWSDTTTNWWGVIARQQSDGSAYGFRIRGAQLTGTGDSNYISLFHINGSGGITTLAESGNNIPAINSGTDIAVSFFVRQDDANSEIDLEAKMTVGSVTRTAATSVAYTAPLAILDPGPMGLIAADNAMGARQFRWDNLDLTRPLNNAVPEPGTAALMLAGLGLLGTRRARHGR